MSTTPRKPAARTAPTEFRARTIVAGLASAGFAALWIPAPVALAAAPADEVYVQEVSLPAAVSGAPTAALNEESSIAAVPPMVQARASSGLEVSAKPARLSRLSGALAAPKVLPAAAYAYCFGLSYIGPAESVSFPATPAGGQSTRTVTVTNTTTATKSVGAVSTSGDFSALSTCDGDLAPGESCTIDVAFSPQAAGEKTGELTLPIDGVAGAFVLPLSAKAALVGGPTPYLYPSYVEFPTTMVGQVSDYCTVWVYNYDFNESGLDLVISRAGISNPAFKIAGNTCNVPIPAYESCEVTMYFQPTVAGDIYGQLNMPSNADPEYTLQADLFGIALPAPPPPITAGTLTRSPTGLVFGPLDVGKTSEPQTIVVRNQPASTPVSGSVELLAAAPPVTISSVVATGDFIQTNDCGKLDSGESCRINVTFKPTDEGERRGTVTVGSDATNSTLVTQLVGTGVLPAFPALELSAYSAAFGSAVMGRPGETKTITVKSIGRADVEIGNIYVTGDFTQTNNCPSVMPPGAQCAVSIDFSPIIPGNRPGSLVIEANTEPPVTEAALTGTGCRIYGPAGSRLSAPACD